jgi:hypothetical protein
MSTCASRKSPPPVNTLAWWHRCPVLVDVKAFGCTGEHLYTVPNVVCGDCVPVNFHREGSAEYGIFWQTEVLEEGQNIEDPADMRYELTCYKEQLTESLWREGLLAKYIDYCCTMKSDQPLTSVLWTRQKALFRAALFLFVLHEVVYNESFLDLWNVFRRYSLVGFSVEHCVEQTLRGRQKSSHLLQSGPIVRRAIIKGVYNHSKHTQSGLMNIVTQGNLLRLWTYRYTAVWLIVNRNNSE